jgi:trehalose 6-phosphate phosphatase
MALEYFFEKDVLKSTIGCRFLLLLDFDGTLVPIQDNPENCYLPDGVKRQLESIASSNRVLVGILSGRSLSDIRARVQVKGLYYGGCHGLEISGPRISYIHPGARAGISLIDEIKRKLQERIGTLDGVLLEDKGLTLAVHYRAANKEDSSIVRKEVWQALSEAGATNGLSLMKGKKVLELVPDVVWDKGKAALLILQRVGEAYAPIYVGDDLTDERAFLALNQFGITVRVGKSTKTIARYYIKGQREVSEFLRYIEAKVL